MPIEKKWFVVFPALLVVGFLAGMGGTFLYVEYVDTPEESLEEATVETSILEEINDVRREHDVAALQENETLSVLAREHAADMAEREFVGHDNPDGDGPSDRVDASPMECERVSENIAQTWWDEPIEASDGGSTRLTSNAELAEWLVEEWLDSPQHRENLLASQWSTTGVGVVVEDSQVFAVQKFCS